MEKPMYQCPCDPACMCIMEEPCLSCETYGEWINNKKTTLEAMHRLHTAGFMVKEIGDNIKKKQITVEEIATIISEAGFLRGFDEEQERFDIAETIYKEIKGE